MSQKSPKIYWRDIGIVQKKITNLWSLWIAVHIFYRSQKNFCSSKFFQPVHGTKTNFAEWKSSYGVAQNGWDWHKMYINFWSGPKKFEPAQNILGPVEGRGTSEQPVFRLSISKVGVKMLKLHNCELSRKEFFRTCNALPFSFVYKITTKDKANIPKVDTK